MAQGELERLVMWQIARQSEVGRLVRGRPDGENLHQKLHRLVATGSNGT